MTKKVKVNKYLTALVPPIIDIFKDSTHKCTVNHTYLYKQFCLLVDMAVHIRATAACALRGKCSALFCCTWFVKLTLTDALRLWPEFRMSRNSVYVASTLPPTHNEISGRRSNKIRVHSVCIKMQFFFLFSQVRELQTSAGVAILFPASPSSFPWLFVL